MITYIDTKNREKYQVLFDKAEKTLIAASEAGTLPAGIDINTLEIATLNQYFAYLKDLISVSSSEDIKRYFTRLPLDEDFFEINANTRAISIPTSFARNGVGVQGDETAEVIYFTIDRYFDSMDLANDDINIVIQWETKDANRQTITGISPNYGKDLETLPGKIIFGWPIYSELTQAAGTIKFAIRFFSLGEANDEGIRSLNYSLSTLPAEVSVGSTLNYDLISKTLAEIDRGKIITGRIKNSGVYDPFVPTPAEPVVTTPLYAIGSEAAARIVDLPTDGDRSKELAISARPADFGAILYDWKQWPYDPSTGEYSNTSTSFTTGVDNGVYEEMTADLGDDTYYRITSAIGASPIVYAPIAVSDYLADTSYNAEEGGFETSEGNYIKLYKKLSVATVRQVGIYTVNVGARNGVNVVTKTMDIADGIKIPGPLKPVVTPPEAGGNVSVTDDDVTHVIVNDGTAILAASAIIGEAGKDAAEVGADPQVVLSYKWKKVVDGVATDVEAASAMTVRAIDADHLPTDPAWLENTEDGTFGIYNQENITLVQDGNTITIYPNSELKTYASTNSAQGSHQWVALDIDTGLSTIVGATWNGAELDASDAAEAIGLGLRAGHIVFWYKADEGTTTRTINDTTLTFKVSDAMPTTPQYSFNENKSEMIVLGLPEEGLDTTYLVEVTATRNGISTAKDSGDYRLTNAPVKPVLKYRELVGGTLKQVVKDYSTQDTAVPYNMKTRTGDYNKIAFSVDMPAFSDSLSYVWMRMNVEDIPSDWEGVGDRQVEKLQIDLDDQLPDLFADLTGNPDIAVDGAFGLTTLTELGEVVDTEDNGPALQLSENTPAGYYYCIVINELNNNRVANVSPFFHVTE